MFEFEWRELEEVKCFRYQEVSMAANGNMEADESHKVSKGMKFLSALRNVWKRDVTVCKSKGGCV